MKSGGYIAIPVPVYSSVQVLSRPYLLNQPFVTKLGMVEHNNEPERHVKNMGSYLQGQGHSEGS